MDGSHKSGECTFSKKKKGKVILPTAGSERHGVSLSPMLGF